jgi:hypothetical protein
MLTGSRSFSQLLEARQGESAAIEADERVAAIGLMIGDAAMPKPCAPAAAG